VSDSENNFIKGILLIYHHPLEADAATVMENVRSFQYSRFKVWSVNTAFGFPESLKEVQFQSLVLHYSLFGNRPYQLPDSFLDYLDHSQLSYKIAFFQDEHHHCRERFAFLNRHAIDCVYTLVEQPYFRDVYLKYTSVKNLINYIPGYVADDLIAVAARLSVPEARRTVDVGYRARPLSFYSGKGAQEKTRIAIEFRERARDSGLKLDIETDEAQRIYGRKWYKFVANCRAVLGVEAGVSIFDVDDSVQARTDEILKQQPGTSFDELSEKLLHQFEDNVYYRTISPRHFEAAAFRVTQILFEGRYSGLMQPMVHYIPLQKDFSNFDDCLRMFHDEALRRELTDNAYRDLIVSGKFSYQSFMQTFDERLIEAGLQPDVSATEAADFSRRLASDQRKLELRARKNRLMYHSDFPGRRELSLIGGPLLRKLRRWRDGSAR